MCEHVCTCGHTRVFISACRYAVLSFFLLKCLALCKYRIKKTSLKMCPLRQQKQKQTEETTSDLETVMH